MSGVRMLHFLKDWWKFIQIHQYQNSIITLTLCCRRYHRRSYCRRSKCRINISTHCHKIIDSCWCLVLRVIERACTDKVNAIKTTVSHARVRFVSFGLHLRKFLFSCFWSSIDENKTVNHIMWPNYFYFCKPSFVFRGIRTWTPL